MKYHIDASNKILGRLASEVAIFLRGKNLPSFVSNQMGQHYVTVYNTDQIHVTGRKMEQKIYLHHSGFAGGQKSETLERLMNRDSRLVLRRAVMGMLPKNRLRKGVIKNLVMFRGSEDKNRV